MRYIFATAAFSALLVVPVHARELGFDTLGFLGGTPSNYRSNAYGLSDDGTWVVGEALLSGTGQSQIRQGFRWSADTGMTPLGTFVDGRSSRGIGVSNDGATVAGYGIIANGNSQAAFWTPSGGLQNLQTSPVDQFDSSSASAISADGSRIFGQQEVDRNVQALVWGETRNIEHAFTTFDAQPRPTYANGMTRDGRFAAGYGTIDGRAHGARYDLTTNEILSIGTSQASPTALGLRMEAVSADGRFVVGWRGTSSVSDAILWDAENPGTLVDLGRLVTARQVSRANAISADGRIIAGRSRVTTSTITGDRAVVWLDGVLNDLNVLAVDLGIDLGGYVLHEANAITPDGLTIVGVARPTNDAGTIQNLPEAFVITIPEPGLAAPLVVAAGLLGRRRR